MAPLTPIGDIGTATLTENTAETVTWDSADWPNGTFVHARDDNGTLKMGRVDGFEDGDTAEWREDKGSISAQNTTVYDGSWSGESTGSGAWNHAQLLTGSGDATLGGDVYAEVFLYEPSGNDARTQLIFAYDGTGDHLMVEGTAEVNNGCSIKNEQGNALPSNENTYQRSYGTWYIETVYWRPGSDDITGTLYDTTRSQLVQNTFSGSGYDDGEIGLAVYRNNTYWDLFLYRRTNARVTTATKSFSGDKQPDLSGLQYSLNNDTLSIDVIGSPGTASEEIVNSGNLDGTQTTATLSWASSHTDFRVRPVFSCSDPRPSAGPFPTVDQIELSTA